MLTVPSRPCKGRRGALSACSDGICILKIWLQGVRLAILFAAALVSVAGQDSEKGFESDVLSAWSMNCNLQLSQERAAAAELLQSDDGEKQSRPVLGRQPGSSVFRLRIILYTA